LIFILKEKKMNLGNNPKMDYDNMDAITLKVPPFQGKNNLEAYLE
jgi:hypothetical protein